MKNLGDIMKKSKHPVVIEHLEKVDERQADVVTLRRLIAKTPDLDPYAELLFAALGELERRRTSAESVAKVLDTERHEHCSDGACDCWVGRAVRALRNVELYYQTQGAG